MSSPVAEKAANDMKTEACGTCTKEVKKTDAAVRCDICQLWHHTSCENVTEAMYSLIQEMVKEDQTDCLHWYCGKCNRVAKNIMCNLTQLTERQEMLEQQIARLDQKVDHQVSQVHTSLKGLSEKVEENTDKLKEFETSSKKHEGSVDEERIMSELRESERKTTAELEERSKRSKNLIIFRLPEHGSKDNDVISKLLDELDTHKPRETRRLGKYSEEKNRPVRLSFKDRSERDDVLQSFHKLKKEKTAAETEDKEGKKQDDSICLQVAMTRDRTPQEREEEEALYKEWKGKKSESDASGDEKAVWIRKNGKVINIGKYPPSAGEKQLE